MLVAAVWDPRVVMVLLVEWLRGIRRSRWERCGTRMSVLQVISLVCYNSLYLMGHFVIKARRVVFPLELLAALEECGAFYLGSGGSEHESCRTATQLATEANTAGAKEGEDEVIFMQKRVLEDGTIPDRPVFLRRHGIPLRELEEVGSRLPSTCGPG